MAHDTHAMIKNEQGEGKSYTLKLLTCLVEKDRKKDGVAAILLCKYFERQQINSTV